jgi:hypothetical protein
MLIQLVLSSPEYKGTKLTPDPWTEYISLQPVTVPVPALWSEAELSLLEATSLEPAVAAQLILLDREFTTIKSKAISVDLGKQIFEHATLGDWIWVDALYRSRSFELPISGASCVPCLDLANHGKGRKAQWQQIVEKQTVRLVLKKGAEVKAGEEITISYGEGKPAAEMLFNYGFVKGEGEKKVMVDLDEVLAERARKDGLLKEKLEVFGKAPVLEVMTDEMHGGKGRWKSPFIEFMCVKEEDGLGFKMEGREGKEERRVVWKGNKDVTRMVGMWDVFMNAQDARNVVRFRAACVVEGIVGKQLDRLRGRVEGEGEKLVESGEVRRTVLDSVLELRRIEIGILEKVLEAVKEEKGRLVKDEKVAAEADAQSAS